MKNLSIKLRLFATSLGLSLMACSGGVPVPITIDQFTFTLSLDESLETATQELKSTGLLPPESTGIPELWPQALPDLCLDLLVETDPDLGGRVDLTPDPAEDQALADQFAVLNSGLIEYIELDRLVLRVEQNSLNVALPVAEIQASDNKNADTQNRLAWMTVGTVGGRSIPAGCNSKRRSAGIAVEPAQTKDLPLDFVPSGESFLTNQMADEICVDRQTSGGGDNTLLVCKEFALRARTRILFDTTPLSDTCTPATEEMDCGGGFSCIDNTCRRQRPGGSVTLRMILGATFYISPL